MRPDALRPATAKAAAKACHKLSSRLSKGEKRDRKRMAELGADYDAAPVPRAACDIFPTGDTERQAARAGRSRSPLGKDVQIRQSHLHWSRPSLLSFRRTREP